MGYGPEKIFKLNFTIARSKVKSRSHYHVAHLLLHFYPTALNVGVLFSPMVSGWAGVRAGRPTGGGKKFVRGVSQKP